MVAFTPAEVISCFKSWNEPGGLTSPNTLSSDIPKQSLLISFQPELNVWFLFKIGFDCCNSLKDSCELS